MIRQKTSEEKATEAAGKRARHAQGIQEAMAESWQYMDNKKECFVLDALPYEKAFLTLKLRRAGSNVSFFKIFNQFIDDEVMDKLYNEFTDEDLILQRRFVNVNSRLRTKKVAGHICMALKMKDLWKAMAVQIRIIGRGVKSTENNPMKRGMEDIFSIS